ncbi:MAG TPA: DJ-1/PfpI family protein, partial [Solirubrobacteraceae bacterium]|nr:DJ-1/PfpI family protein [Solirubrobacteraceae bacterium]
VAIPLYDRFTARDAVGPYEVLSRIPGATVHFLSADGDPGPRTTETGMLTMNADAPLDSLPHPDVVVVPGGFGTRKLLDHEPTLEWIRTAHETSRYTTSVCTGALLLGAAGILDGLEATTYWTERETLREFGATPSTDRVVEQGKVITAAGVSSGIDMALVLTAHLTSPEVAQAIQLGIEYDPQPPYDTGSPEKAPPEMVEGLRAIIAAENA